MKQILTATDRTVHSHFRGSRTGDLKQVARYCVPLSEQRKTHSFLACCQKLSRTLFPSAPDLVEKSRQSNGRGG